MTTVPSSVATAPAPDIGIDQPGSFGWRVFHERHPVLVRQVLAATPYPPKVRRRLSRLVDGSRTGLIPPLESNAPDAGRWQSWGSQRFDTPWSQAPFLWAESYFYRRLLDAVGYFSAGAWEHLDPFAPMKAAELRDRSLDGDLNGLDRLDDLPSGAQTAALLHHCLWGNRADLGFRVDNDLGDLDPHGALVADDTDQVVAALAAGQRQVVLVADNAGRELLADLLLVDHLLTTGQADKVTLHVKPQPYYVSDATGADALACLHRLSQAEGMAGKAASRLTEGLTNGRLVLRAHPFSCAPLPLRDLPGDLADEWSRASLIILKGDLNYRRLVGDQHYPAILPLGEVTGYFPAPFVALRTLKSEVVVGLTPETVARLEHGDDGDRWRVNGAHGLVQARL